MKKLKKYLLIGIVSTKGYGAEGPPSLRVPEPVEISALRHDVTSHAIMIQPRSINALMRSQEAITSQRRTIIESYRRMMENPEYAELITKNLLSEEDADTAFNECFNSLNTFFDQILEKNKRKDLKFRVENAKRTLMLMNGDSSIEHHDISYVIDYREYRYDSSFPTLLQLVVLSWRLSQVDVKSFIETTLAEEFSAPALWNEWKRPFQKNALFVAILQYEDFGQSLAVDRAAGSPFINSLANVLNGSDELPASSTIKAIKKLRKKLFLQQYNQITPLLEALFMVMRGHNDNLLSESEPNSTACAEGAYLNIIKSIGKTLGTNVFSSLVIEDCEQEQNQNYRTALRDATTLTQIEENNRQHVARDRIRHNHPHQEEDDDEPSPRVRPRRNELLQERLSYRTETLFTPHQTLIRQEHITQNLPFLVDIITLEEIISEDDETQYDSDS